MASRFIEKAQHAQGAAAKAQQDRPENIASPDRPQAPSAEHTDRIRIVAAAPGIISMQIEGDIDAARLGSLEPAFSGALRDAGTGLVVDLADVDRIDAAGIGFFVAFHKRLRAQQAELVLADIRPNLNDFLRTMGFDSYFSIAVDAARAVSYLQAVQAAQSVVRSAQSVAQNAADNGLRCPVCGENLELLASVRTARGGATTAKAGAAGAGRRNRCKACGAVMSLNPDGQPVLG